MFASLLTGILAALGLNFFIGLCFTVIVSDYILRKARRSLNKTKFHLRVKLNYLFYKLEQFGFTINPWKKDKHKKHKTDGDAKHSGKKSKDKDKDKSKEKRKGKNNKKERPQKLYFKDKKAAVVSTTNGSGGTTTTATRSTGSSKSSVRYAAAFAVPTKAARVAMETQENYGRYTPWSELQKKVVWTRPLDEVEERVLLKAGTDNSSVSDSSQYSSSLLFLDDTDEEFEFDSAF